MNDTNGFGAASRKAIDRASATASWNFQMHSPEALTRMFPLESAGKTLPSLPSCRRGAMRTRLNFIVHIARCA